jgi:hypothetical protein
LRSVPNIGFSAFFWRIGFFLDGIFFTFYFE